MRRVFTLFLLLAATVASAQPPAIVNVQLEKRQPQPDLTGEVHRLQGSEKPLWLGYSVAAIAMFQSGWQGERVSYLERREYHSEYTTRTTSPQDRMIVLLRFANGRIDQIRAEAPDRTLDAGGLRFVWLTAVPPQDSVALLQSVALTPAVHSLRDNAVFLISQHNAPAVIPALLAIAAPASDPALRDKAAFWLASARGHDGFLALQHFAQTDTDPAFREKLTFDLTINTDPAALDELIRMAHQDPAAQVRKQAEFWMSQEASKRDANRIAAQLYQSTRSDPDAEVRKQAVFTIAQLPQDQAIPQLTQFAATSPHPEVRKQAIFWLGQSDDPRALASLITLLKSPASK